MRTHNIRNNNQILHGDERKIFTGSTANAEAPDTFAAANHFLLKYSKRWSFRAAVSAYVENLAVRLAFNKL